MLEPNDASTPAARGRVKTPQPLPRLAGSPIRHLRAYRRDATKLQMEVMHCHPELAAVRIGLFDVVGINSPAIAHEVLVTKEYAFTKSPAIGLFLRGVLGDGLLTSEHGFHARQRRLIAPAFTHGRVAGYADTMAERALRTVRAWKDGETLDAADAMMRLTLEIVGKTLFDTEVSADADAIGDALTETMENTMASLTALIPLPPMVPTLRNLRSRRAIARLDAVIYRIIAERRLAPRDRGDLLSVLLAANDEDGGSMTDTQVRDEALTLLLAGHETTANALAWSLYLLARHPEIRARAEREVRPFAERGTPLTHGDLSSLPLTLAILKEAMRLYPPAYLLSRRAIRDVHLGGVGGYELKKGTAVFINTLGIHRSNRSYENADRFDPERFMGEREKALPRGAYLPFGAGSRVCIGNHFALMEGHLLLATILGHARLDQVTPREIEMQPLVTLRPRGGAPMRVTRLGIG